MSNIGQVAGTPSTAADPAREKRRNELVAGATARNKRADALEAIEHLNADARVGQLVAQEAAGPDAYQKGQTNGPIPAPRTYSSMAKSNYGGRSRTGLWVGIGLAVGLTGLIGFSVSHSGGGAYSPYGGYSYEDTQYSTPPVESTPSSFRGVPRGRGYAGGPPATWNQFADTPSDTIRRTFLHDITGKAVPQHQQLEPQSSYNVRVDAVILDNVFVTPQGYNESDQTFLQRVQAAIQRENEVGGDFGYSQTNAPPQPAPVAAPATAPQQPGESAADFTERDQLQTLSGRAMPARQAGETEDNYQLRLYAQAATGIAAPLVKPYEDARAYAGHIKYLVAHPDYKE